MSENNTNRNASNDEIDLLDLFNRIGRTLTRWANALGRAFLVTIVFLLKRWLPLGLSIITGLVIAFFMKSTSVQIFSSDIILRSNVIDNAQMISYINRLQSLDKQSLSEAFNIPEENCENIISVGAFWIIDLNKDKIPDNVDYKNSHNIYDTTNIRMKDRFDIKITIKTPQQLNLIREGILRYIENDSLFQQNNRLRLSQNMEMMNRLDYDIQQLDSLQKVKYFEETRNRKPQNGGQMVFLQEQNTQLLYRDIQTLYTRKQTLQQERELYNGIVTVLSDFTIPTAPVNGLMFYAKQIIPLIFCITLLLLVLIANRKKLLEVYRKY